MVSSRDRNEERAGRETSALLPALPGRLHALEGDALVLLPHHDDDLLRRRIPVDCDRSHLLEETAVDLEVLTLAVVEEPHRIPGRQLLRPALPESQRRRDQQERRRHPAPGRFQSHQRPERAPDDDVGLLPPRRPDRLLHDRLESQLFEGRPIQIRSHQAVLIGG